MDNPEPQDEQERQVEPAVAANVRLRLATPDDNDFLLRLFASTRSDELAALAWNPAQAEMFIRMQYNTQRENYSANYPAAQNQIVLLDDRPIGRILVNRGEDEYMLVDIAILADDRNGGIGRFLLEDLLREASFVSKPVTLQVLSYNPARRLYERLGFSVTGSEGIYIDMKWSGPAPE